MDSTVCDPDIFNERACLALSPAAAAATSNIYVAKPETSVLRQITGGIHLKLNLESSALHAPAAIVSSFCQQRQLQKEGVAFGRPPRDDGGHRI